MNTAWAVVKIRPEKNSGVYGIWAHDLCDTGAVLAQVVFITTKIAHIHVFIRSSSIWLSYIHRRLSLSLVVTVCFTMPFVQLQYEETFSHDQLELLPILSARLLCQDLRKKAEFIHN